MLFGAQMGTDGSSSPSSGPKRVMAIWVVGSLLGALLIAAPASAGRRTPKCFGRSATIVGTDRSNELMGTRRADVIVGRGGDDMIFGRGGNDLVCMGGGFDFVFAGGGHDRLSGGKGPNVYFPGRGDDTVRGGRGDFDFVTYEGQDVGLEANLGLGFINGQGTDAIRDVEGVGGGEGNDTLHGDDGNNDLWGFGGDDVVNGGGGSDFLNSGAGNDQMDGGDGFDFLEQLSAHGGPALGDDIFAETGVTLNLSEDTSTGGADVGTDIVRNIEGGTGTLGNDTLTGDGQFNELIGFEGNDTIDLGGAGEPIENGLHDVAVPGPGDDSVIGSPTGFDGVGYDFLSVIDEPTAGANIDLAEGTATGPDVGTDELTSIDSAIGTFFDDTLVGTAQENWLIGLDGSDTLHGAAGDDMLDADAFTFGLEQQLGGTDTVDGGPGTDTCLGAETATACEATTLAGFKMGHLRFQSYAGVRPMSYQRRAM
jgi:Ca2+-binding RTX toxin-like protein